MARAGAFIDRLEWLKRLPTAKGDGFGQRPQGAFESKGHLWCAVEDIAANRETRKESERQVTTATIRIRNYPGVKAGDQLRDAILGQTWDVRSAVELDNETVCEVER
jgi:hypothetical protein